MAHLSKRGGKKPDAARKGCEWCSAAGYPDADIGCEVEPTHPSAGFELVQAEQPADEQFCPGGAGCKQTGLGELAVRLVPPDEGGQAAFDGSEAVRVAHDAREGAISVPVPDR